ncbi:MAG: GntR family transcriptional regulator [Bacteroidetes bacterium GWA2_30_7]|nr:MAG: GntR family transcriptional regulator [Bacteroidetes bacterium GWA2_30_7]
MLEIGKYNNLTILRHTSVGLFLSDESGEEVLLPTKYCPEKVIIGNKINVLVYRDNAERKIATTLTPKILLHEFALLQVTAEAEVGTFVDWGMEKDILVPFKEQRMRMEKERWYIVYLDLDKETDRLYASNKVDKFLSNDILTIKEGQKVDILIWKQTDIGFSVIINNKHSGLIFDNEIFKKLNIGEKLTGYVKQIREDNKVDISLHAIGFENSNDPNCELIFQTLIDNNGFLAITDKSSPDDIYTEFGISKKAFKKAIGTLYKQRKIELLADGIKSVNYKK